jgi:hypothetical protein
LQWGILLFVDAAPIDPRDIAWQVSEPAYRVYFWDRLGGPGSMWRSDEWRLTGADVGEVLEWANRNAASRYFTVGVEVTDGAAGLGMVRLHGWEPTD